MGVLYKGNQRITPMATVKVPSPMPMTIKKTKDNNGKLINDTTHVIDIDGATDIGDYALQYAYSNNTNQTAIPDFSSLTTISGANACTRAFQNTSVTGFVDLSSLLSITGSHACDYMFQNCTGITGIDLSNLVNITSAAGCSYMFSGCTGITGILDLSSLKKIKGVSSYSADQTSCSFMFQGCTGITSVKFDSLENIEDGTIAGMFKDCINLSGAIDLSKITGRIQMDGMNSTFYNCAITSVDLSNITYCYGGALRYAFQGCTNLTSVDISNLCDLTPGTTSYAFSEMCSGCTSLTSFSFTSLATQWHKDQRVFYRTFNGCTSLTDVYFPALYKDYGSYTDVFKEMLRGCTNVTVHFPNNLQSLIGSWADTTAGFGGTNTTILYDLPASLKIYVQSVGTLYRYPKYDTSTALAWHLMAPTSYMGLRTYYTQGLSDPQVNDYLYTNAECTQGGAPIKTVD